MNRNLSLLKIMHILGSLVLAPILFGGCASPPEPSRMHDELIQSFVQQALEGELDSGTIVARMSRGQVVQVWRIDYNGKLTQVQDDDREQTLAQAASYLKPHRDCFRDTSYCKVVMLDVEVPPQATIMRCEGGGDLRPGLCDELQLAQVSGQWQVLSKVRTAGRGPCQCQALRPIPTPTRQRMNEP